MKSSHWLALLAFAPTNVHATVEQVRSPDGTLVFSIDDAGERLHYTMSRRDEVVIAPSQLHLNLVDPAPFQRLAIDAVARRHVDARHTLIATKAAAATDRYNEMIVEGRETGGSRRRLQIFVRAYDDGLAFRYRIPPQPDVGSVAISAENTVFAFSGDDRCWGFNVGRMDTSHEGEFEPVRASDMRHQHHYDSPLSCRTASGRTAFLIAEADLKDYAGLYLRARGDGGLGVETQLSFQYEHRQQPVRRDMGADGVQSPWRVVLMADHEGQLIESNTIGNLNPAPVGDFSWVKPGKAAWDWWNGPYVPPPGRGGMDMQTFKLFIDFAAKSGLDYYMIDEGWSKGSGTGGAVLEAADILNEKPGVNMPELVEYARTRGIGLMVWVQWSLLDARLDAALDRYAAWGLKGIKVDFMDRNDQEMVGFYHRVLEAAAKRKLLVNFHGAYPPTGLNRTWPNFITQEGVMGAEYNKWSTRVTARHNVTIPFTRMVLGPMDYTPGGFRNMSPRDFKVSSVPPNVQTSRAAALAMYVVFESPLQMVSDSPDIYDGADGFDFLKSVPTAWDETRFLAGEIGKYVVVARRKGRDWYIGAMTDSTARTIRIPLSFLGTETYTADIREDGDSPEKLRMGWREGLRSSASLSLHMKASGGAAVRLTLAPFVAR